MAAVQSTHTGSNQPPQLHRTFDGLAGPDARVVHPRDPIKRAYSLLTGEIDPADDRDELLTRTEPFGTKPSDEDSAVNNEDEDELLDLYRKSGEVFECEDELSTGKPITTAAADQGPTCCSETDQDLKQDEEGRKGHPFCRTYSLLTGEPRCQSTTEPPAARSRVREPSTGTNGQANSSNGSNRKKTTQARVSGPTVHDNVPVTQWAQSSFSASPALLPSTASPATTDSKLHHVVMSTSIYEDLPKSWERAGSILFNDTDHTLDHQSGCSNVASLLRHLTSISEHLRSGLEELRRRSVLLQQYLLLKQIIESTTKDNPTRRRAAYLEIHEKVRLGISDKADLDELAEQYFDTIYARYCRWGTGLHRESALTTLFFHDGDVRDRLHAIVMLLEEMTFLAAEHQDAVVQQLEIPIMYSSQQVSMQDPGNGIRARYGSHRSPARGMASG